MAAIEKVEELLTPTFSHEWKDQLVSVTCEMIDRHERKVNPFAHRSLPPVYRLLMTKARKTMGQYVAYPPGKPQANVLSRADLPRILHAVIEDLLGGGLSEQDIRHLFLNGL